MNLRTAIIAAPMAGGITTPELIAAVGGAGGLGFLPAGYKSAAAVAADIAAVRALTDEPFGLNIFVPGGNDGDAGAIERYARSLEPEATRLGAELGEPRYEDDAYALKLALAAAEKPAAVSFTFGCPSRSQTAALKEAGIEVWVTVTSPEEAELAASCGADVLILQGTEAGGHRGYFSDGPGAEHEEYGVLELITATRARVSTPVVAAGGIMDADGVSAVLEAGAQAAQVGTAFMLAPEAGTAPAHRTAFASGAGTRLTHAFTGRTARGIVNRFMDEHDAQAPYGYPQIHHLTAPLRAAAKAQNDASALHLWAGRGYRLAQELPAAQIVKRLSAAGS